MSNTKLKVRGKEYDLDDAEQALADTLKKETLFGDVRDALLDRIRNLKKPWQKMTEAEQRELVEGVERGVKHLIQQMTTIIAADGRKTLVGTLDSIAVKGGMKAVIKLSKSDKNRHELVDAEGKEVLVVVADAEPYLGEESPADIDRDQMDMGWGEGD